MGAINTQYFSQLTAQINAAATCAELQAISTAALTGINLLTDAVNEELANIAPALALLNPPTNPTAVITWVSNFINEYLGPELAAFGKYSTKAAALAAEVTAIVAAINSAQIRIGSCTVTLPTVINPNIPTPPSPPTYPPFGGGGSIAGSATTASPLILVNDVVAPGNSYYYGTNGAGVKGWYVLTGGGGGGGTVSNVTSTAGTLAVTNPGGPTVNVDLHTAGVEAGSYTSANITVDTYGRVTAASNGGSTPTVGLPATISDLVYWFDASTLRFSSGSAIAALQNSNPYLPALTPFVIGAGAVRSGTLLNGNTTITFSASADSGYLFQGVPRLPLCTIFVVYNPASIGSSQAIVCGSVAGSFQFGLVPSGAFEIDASNVAVVGNSTATLTAGTWVQANATYNSGSGAWAFRVGRSASGSGTTITNIVSASNGVGYNPQVGGQYLSGSIAELIIYNRVLSSTEITTVENYLNTKWGV